MAEAYHVSKHIVYLGETGFPYGLAPIQRQILISLGLVEAGAHVLVVSNKGVFNPSKVIDLNPSGTYRGIDYEYSSGEIYRRSEFWTRNLLKIRGIIKEFGLLIKLKKMQKIDAAIVATMRFQSIFYYFLLSRFLKFKILLNYVECNRAITNRSKWRDRVNDFLIDRWGICCADAVLPISEYLKNYVQKVCPQTPQLKIPIIGDFSYKHEPVDDIEVPYFLYCGSANYLELIDFIIEAFEKITSEHVYLYLVVSGDTTDLIRFNERVVLSSKRSQIRVFSGIPFHDLLKKYREAIGLLIPLRNNIQDIARFPHKIGEYLASGVPVITTRFGEIGHYFTDGKNAVISNHYEPEEYSKKMNYVLDYPDEAKKIGEEGRNLGRKEFDYKQLGSLLFEFIQTLK